MASPENVVGFVDIWGSMAVLIFDPNIFCMFWVSTMNEPSHGFLHESNYCGLIVHNIVGKNEAWLSMGWVFYDCLSMSKISHMKMEVLPQRYFHELWNVLHVPSLLILETSKPCDFIDLYQGKPFCSWKPHKNGTACIYLHI